MMDEELIEYNSNEIQIERDTIKYYLAGTYYEDAPHKSWKLDIVNTIQGFKIIEPKFVGIKHDFYDPHPISGAWSTDIIKNDKFHIQNSDILIAYIHKITIGTTMEIFYANSLGKRVYVIDPNGENKLKTNLWLFGHCDCVFSSVEECATHIMNMMYKLHHWYRDN